MNDGKMAVEAKVNLDVEKKTLLWSVGYVAILIACILTTRLHAFIDVALLTPLAIFFLEFRRKGPPLPSSVKVLLSAFFAVAIYTSMVSLFSASGEFIWPLKLARTCVSFFLLFYFYRFLSRHVKYDEFCEYIVWSVVAHSFIIYFAVTIPGFREALYAITGYEPRGPEWSRCPGLTISFNSPSVVHIAALWMIARNKTWNLATKLGLVALILPSLFFLGRFVAYIGLPVILGYLLYRSFAKTAIAIAVVASVISSVNLLEVIRPESLDTTVGQIAFNITHKIAPLLTDEIFTYSDTFLDEHFNLPSDPFVLAFGNSKSGNIGIIGGLGDTGSDMGVINSINANGVFGTTILYLMYLYTVVASRKGDWPTVAFIAYLSVGLSFKETGLFSAHATPLLFLTMFYQLKNASTHVENSSENIEGGLPTAAEIERQTA